MPTLNEFIQKTLIENNLTFNASDIEKFVVSEAKKRAKNNVAAISDEEVRQMIIGYKTDENSKETVKEQRKENECQDNQTQQQTSLF